MTADNKRALWSSINDAFKGDILLRAQWTMALRNARPYVLETMIRIGTDPNEATLQGRHPLTELVMAEIFTPDHDQSTSESISKLIAAGSNPLAPDHRTLTPADYALGYGSKNVVMAMIAGIMGDGFRPRPALLMAFVADEMERNALYRRIEHNLQTIRSDFSRSILCDPLPPQEAMPRPNAEIARLQADCRTLEILTRSENILLVSEKSRLLEEKRQSLKDVEASYARILCLGLV
jgi:hypothetical protein